MNRYFFRFTCPNNGVKLDYVLDQPAIDADTEFARPCARFTGPRGCGESHTWKPSQGILLGTAPSPGPVTATDPYL